jgi:hypothetical protein
VSWQHQAPPPVAAIAASLREPVNALLNARIGATLAEGRKLGRINEAGDVPGVIDLRADQLQTGAKRKNEAKKPLCHLLIQLQIGSSY